MSTIGDPSATYHMITTGFINSSCIDTIGIENNRNTLGEKD